MFVELTKASSTLHIRIRDPWELRYMTTHFKLYLSSYSTHRCHVFEKNVSDTKAFIVDSYTAVITTFTLTNSHLSFTIRVYTIPRPPANDKQDFLTLPPLTAAQPPLP